MKTAFILVAEFLIILTISALAGLVWWSLSGSKENGLAFTILATVAASVIHFAYDELPKGKLGHDGFLILASFLVEAFFMFLAFLPNALLTLALIFVELAFGPMTVGTFSERMLVFWFLINVCFGLKELPKFFQTRAERPSGFIP